MTDLAGCFHRLQRANRFFVRRLQIGPMDQHEIYIIGVQALEAAFGPFGDVGGGGIPPGDGRVANDGRVVVEDEADFGHQNDILAPVAQAARQQLFRRERAIHFRGVEERDAVVDRHVHGAHRFVNVDFAVLRGAKLPSAEAYRRASQVRVAETSLFHAAFLSLAIYKRRKV